MVSTVYLMVRIGVMAAMPLMLTAEYCPQERPTGILKFTQKLGSKDYVRVSHAVSILCCANGYESITWYKEYKGKWERFPPHSRGDNNTHKFEERGQILRIVTATLTDQTHYRCDATNGSQVIRHITDLHVLECDPIDRGPLPISPFPENKTIYEYGWNISLHCTGDFGCHEEGVIQLAIWKIENKFNISIENISDRYNVEYFNYSNHSVKEAILYIAPVTEEDTKEIFVCVLADAQATEGQTNQRVRITKKDIPKTPWLMIGVVMGGCGLFVILWIGSVLAVRARYGPQIRLFCSSRLSILGSKYVDKETYSYNLFIYHAVEDEEIACDIKGYLTGLGYKVYITADIKGNENVMNVFKKKSVKSAMVMFLYSDALLADDLANFFVQSFINDRKGRDIMFLEIAAYKPKDVMNWTQHAKEKKKYLKGKRNDVGRIDIETEIQSEEDIVAELTVERVHREEDEGELKFEEKSKISNNLKFWKVLPRIKVPADKANTRKLTNFICSLQNKIPRFEDQIQPRNNGRVERNRNSSSTKPLLSDQQGNEPVSPPIQDRDGAYYSPATDEVFTYD